MDFLIWVKNRWYTEGGYGEVLRIAIPLIISTGSWSVQHFVDRMFLTWYSPEAIAAAMPAGILNFTVTCIFIGTASYVGTFVAQYYGARQYEHCGYSLWQGLYISAIGGVVMIAIMPASDLIFTYIGHAPEIVKCESIYFKILCFGAMPAIASSSMSAFFSGLGRTKPVMWVNISITAVNLTLDWLLIFGNFGFPEMGIAGAGIATVGAFYFNMFVYFIILARPSYANKYATIKGWRFNRAIFSRLIRFGFPNGIQFFIDIAGFTIFILLIGRLGTVSLAATNIALNINTLAFMPMIGMSIAISVLVGQRLGENRPELAEFTTFSSFHITFIYMTSVALFYVLLPDIFMMPFAAQSDPQQFAPVRDVAVVLLRFVAFYSVFDTLNMVFVGAIKGAGDTRFVMFTIVIVSIFVLILPTYTALVVLSTGIYSGWLFVTAYIIVLGIIFLFRFLGGKWKSMRVIETGIVTVSQAFPQSPAGE
ncbi:MAG: MATE family efflux transporter [Thermodesulfobacteriota bacterium]|nr:MATE family efflux transporter [Thermodesulfobacteriota bacterium]